MDEIRKTTSIFTQIEKVEKTEQEQNREEIEKRIFGKLLNEEKTRIELENYINHYLGGDEDYKKLDTTRMKELVIKHYLSECIYKMLGIKVTEINCDDAHIKFKQEDYNYWYYLTFSRIPEDGE